MTVVQGPTARKSLPLTDGDLEELEQLRSSPERRSALARLAGAELSGSTSEARLLHAIFEAGLRAVRELAEDEGYAELARQQDPAARQGTARRRRPDWAVE